MKNIREIKQRITSVKNTSKITRAMQLIAASKKKQSQEKTLAVRPYSALLAKMLMSLSEKGEDMAHPFFEKRKIWHRGILIVGTDKGLCGSLNQNLFQVASTTEMTSRFICVGKKSVQFLSRTERDIIADFKVSDPPKFSELRIIVEYLIKIYLEQKIDTIEVLYPRFVNTLKQEPTLTKLAPFKNLKADLVQLQQRLDPLFGKIIQDERQMLFEPSQNEILSELLPVFLKQEIYQMLLDAKASEHSARMVAMKTATDNAHDLVEELTLEYNKFRQFSITQEIVETAASNPQLLQ